MNKAADATRAQTIDIRFGQVGVLQVRIRTTNPAVILEELSARIATAPQFFERTAVCLDLGGLGRTPDIEEVRGAVDAVRQAGMIAVGLAHDSPGVDELSRVLDIPVLAHFRAQSQPVPVVHPPEKAPPPPVTIAPALMHYQPVRSGQRLYARNRELVVTATVGAGAEVMADGCVHIYGALRGRAMAGAAGEVTARVFCQEFHAELVAIAGVFRVFETIPPELAGKPVQAWLTGDDLHFARIGG
jgi:septum site-determining protein MinC